VKLKALKEYQPQIIVYGNSWVNQYRRSMFSPRSFYNCSNQDPKLTSAWSFLKEAKEINPQLEVAIVMLHPWHFRSDVYERSKNISPSIEKPTLSLKEYIKRLQKKDLYKLLVKLDTSKTIGIRAIPQNRGARLSDGSVSFGRHHLRTQGQHSKRELWIIDRAAIHIKKNSYYKNFDQPLDKRTLALMSNMTRDLESIGVSIVFVIPPIHDVFINILNADKKKYQLWHEFNSTKTQAKFSNIAPTYNFSAFDSFGGTTDMTYDGWHSTELAAQLMVAKMQLDEKSPDHITSLPSINPDSIRTWYPTVVSTLQKTESKSP